MWLYIWIVLSLFVLISFGWSLFVLYQQKHSWRQFAGKRKFEYDHGKVMESPSMKGFINDYVVNIYTGRQQTADARGQRQVTVIEIEMGGGLPTTAAISTKDYTAFIANMIMSDSYKPDYKDWDSDYIVIVAIGPVLQVSGDRIQRNVNLTFHYFDLAGQ